MDQAISCFADGHSLNSLRHTSKQTVDNAMGKIHSSSAMNESFPSQCEETENVGITPPTRKYPNT
eukprot:5344878-Amphidinium_carterae.1